jgi:tRNA (guanosine-2'-O-)-methyltransferase
MQRSSRRAERIKAVLARSQPDLSVVMENIHDPHNVSAVFRSCDAVGIRRVDLLYTMEKFPRIGKKSSSSANKWIACRKHRSVDACYSALRAEGFSIYATHLQASSMMLYDLDLRKKVAFVFGNEHRGVSEEALAKADGSVQIPMFGMIQSLNVSVACAVCLYEALRQRLSAGDYTNSKFDHHELALLFEQWIKF